MALVLSAWTAIAFVYRLAEDKQANRLYMTSGMGLSLWTLTAALMVVLLIECGADLTKVHYSQLLLGAMMGLVMVVGIPTFLAAVARGDLSITWTVLTLSFALASLLAMLYPGEKPSVQGLVGLAFAAGAVVLLGMDMAHRHRGEGPGKPRKGWGLFMGISFLTNTLSMYGTKLQGTFAPPVPAESLFHKVTFLMTMGAVACVGGLLLARFMKWPGSTKAGFATGALAGTLTFFGTGGTLLALGNAGVPAHVMFPATTGGSNVLVVALSVLLLKERPGKLGWAGIATGTVALVLLGLAAS
jgi:uncharacterized membrane protein